jgi:hypothetical protein
MWPHIIEVKRVYDVYQYIFSGEESMCWTCIMYSLSKYLHEYWPWLYQPRTDKAKIQHALEKDSTLFEQFDNRFDDVGVSLSGLDTTEKKESKSTSFFFALHTRTMRMMTTACLFLFVFKRVVIDWVRVVMWKKKKSTTNSKFVRSWQTDGKLIENQRSSGRRECDRRQIITPIKHNLFSDIYLSFVPRKILNKTFGYSALTKLPTQIMMLDIGSKTVVVSVDVCWSDWFDLLVEGCESMCDFVIFVFCQ